MLLISFRGNYDGHQRSRYVLLFSCHLFGQLCLGGPGYSSRTVTVGPKPVRRIDTDYNAKLNIEHLFER